MSVQLKTTIATKTKNTLQAPLPLETWEIWRRWFVTPQPHQSTQHWKSMIEYRSTVMLLYTGHSCKWHNVISCINKINIKYTPYSISCSWTSATCKPAEEENEKRAQEEEQNQRVDKDQASFWQNYQILFGPGASLHGARTFLCTAVVCISNANSYYWSPRNILQITPVTLLVLNICFNLISGKM